MNKNLTLALFFFSGLLAALIWWMPVQLIVSFIDQKNIRLEAPGGTLARGSLVLSSNQLPALPIHWQLCSMQLTQPVGVCMQTRNGNINVSFGVVPWKLGNTPTLYNLTVDSPITDLANLHPALAGLGLIQGNAMTDLKRLVYDLQNQSIAEVNGTIQLTDIAALGLDIGNIRVEVTQQEPNQTISFEFEGGDVNELILLGSGTFAPLEKKLSLQTTFRSNKPSVLKLLGNFAKKTGDSSYEWTLSTSI